MLNTERRRRQSGSSLIEFTLVGIPLMFVLISTFEISRGMWMYETLSHAVRLGVRYSVVHGRNCSPINIPNSCLKTVQDVAGVIQNAGVGLLPDKWQNLTFTSGTSSDNCGTLTACLNDSTTFPGPDNGADNAVGARVTISALYPFQSAITMFWPGAANVGTFGTINLGAISSERIEF